MKRIFALLFCLLFLLSAVACTGNGATSDLPSEMVGVSGTEEGNTDGTGDISMTPSTDSGTDEGTPSTDTGTKTPSTSTDKPEETGPWAGYAFDTSVEHKFFATDIKGHSILLYDLNKTEGDLDQLKNNSCIVWTWTSGSDSKCKIKPGAGIDAAKFRYSEYYKKDVVIACSSSGGAYVIDYATSSVLWEYRVGDGPHSIEMMPNGDVVVAASGNGVTAGKLVYIPLSAGKKSPSSTVPSPTAHGVSYDPVQNCLWVMENTDVACFTVTGTGTANAALVRDEARTVSLARKDSGGHVISPVTGTPGLYWVAGTGKLWQFDSKAGTVTNTFPNSGALSLRNIKGISSFADGTAVMTFAGLGGNTTHDWSSTALRFLLFKKQSDGSLRAIVKDVSFKNREYYKVFPFSKDYQ